MRGMLKKSNQYRVYLLSLVFLILSSAAFFTNMERIVQNSTLLEGYFKNTPYQLSIGSKQFAWEGIAPVLTVKQVVLNKKSDLSEDLICKSVEAQEIIGHIRLWQSLWQRRVILKKVDIKAPKIILINSSRRPLKLEGSSSDSLGVILLSSLQNISKQLKIDKLLIHDLIVYEQKKESNLLVAKIDKLVWRQLKKGNTDTHYIAELALSFDHIHPKLWFGDKVKNIRGIGGRLITSFEISFDAGSWYLSEGQLKIKDLILDNKKIFEQASFDVNIEDIFSDKLHAKITNAKIINHKNRINFSTIEGKSSIINGDVQLEFSSEILPLGKILKVFQLSSLDLGEHWNFNLDDLIVPQSTIVLKWPHDAPINWTVQADFERAALKSSYNQLAIQEIKGHIYGNQLKGELTFDCMPKMPNLAQCKKEAGPDDIISASLQWRQEEKGRYRWSLVNLALQLCGLTAHSQGHLWYENEKPYLELMGDIQHLSLGNALRLLMPYIPNEGLQQWLLSALDSPESVSGKYLIKGPLDRWPWPEDSTLQADLEVKQFDFHFHENWPPLKNVDAYISVQGKKLKLLTLGGTLHQAPIIKAESEFSYIDNINTIPVTVTSKAPLDSIIAMLQKSSVASDAFTALEDFSAETDLKIDLVIPIDDDEKFKMRGQATLSQGQFYLMKNNAFVVKDFSGKLSLSQDVMSINPALDAVFKDADKDRLTVQIQGEGNLLIHDTKKNTTGFTYQTAMDVNYHQVDDGEPSFYVKFNAKKGYSQLTQLNKLLNKHLYALNGTIVKKLNYCHVDVSGANKMNVELESLKEKNGNNNAEQWKLNGKITHFDDEEFLYLLHFIIDHFEYSTKINTPFFIDSLKINQAYLLGQPLDHLDISMYKKNFGYELFLNGEQIKGKIHCDHDFKNWYANFRELYLKKESQGNFKEINTNNIPNVRVHVDKLYWRGEKVGKLDGLLITKFLKTKASLLNLADDRFDWRDWHKPHFLLHIDFANISHFWQYLGFSGFDSRSGHMNMKIYWPPSVEKVQIKHLSGPVKFRLNSAHITLNPKSAQSQGLARMLSLFNVNKLPRRLMLDFSDITQNKHQFKQIAGNAHLNDGIVHIEHMALNGSDANVNLSGTANLINRQLDLSMILIPQITSGLPLVATVIGTPVLGLATWLASNLIGDTINQISKYEFKITGDWLNAKISRVKPNSRKKDKSKQ